MFQGALIGIDKTSIKYLTNFIQFKYILTMFFSVFI